MKYPLSSTCNYGWDTLQIAALFASGIYIFDYNCVGLYGHDRRDLP